MKDYTIGQGLCLIARAIIVAASIIKDARTSDVPYRIRLLTEND